MPNLPAFCNTCGFTFQSSILLENSTNISISDITVQCPRCGNMARVPDGIYDVVGNTINVLVNSNRSVSEFSRILEVLEKARNQQKKPEEILSTVKKELPELSTLADTLPKTRAELYAFIAIIVTIIGMIIAFLNKKEEPKIEIHNVINNMSEKKLNIEVNQPNQSIIKNEKFGRNKICYCGSGRKYKKCHGAAIK